MQSAQSTTMFVSLPRHGVSQKLQEAHDYFTDMDALDIQGDPSLEGMAKKVDYIGKVAAHVADYNRVNVLAQSPTLMLLEMNGYNFLAQDGVTKLLNYSSDYKGIVLQDAEYLLLESNKPEALANLWHELATEYAEAQGGYFQEDYNRYLLEGAEKAKLDAYKSSDGGIWLTVQEGIVYELSYRSGVRQID